MPVVISGMSDAHAALSRVDAAMRDPLAAHAAAARIIADAATPPIRTGRLSQSVRPLPGPGARVGTEVRYAALVENRTHFLRRAVTDTMPQWLAAYAAAIVAAWQGSS